jgi:hypothetical protein
MIHFKKCYTTMQELLDKFPLPDSDEPISFLDIACAPGGFSQYLIDHYPNGTGYGITLPEKLGGFPVMVNSYRFLLSFFDLLSHPLDPAPELVDAVDIAIGDAQYFPRSPDMLEEYKGKKAGTVTGGRIGLLLREFILAFEALKNGGTFIFRFVVWEHVHANIIRLFFLCYDLFERVEPFKSEYQHTADCTFYAVCSGFNRAKYEELDISTELKVAYARVVLSPPFAAVHNGTINCFQVIHVNRNEEKAKITEPVLDKPDAHIFETMYPFKDLQDHPHFHKLCNMFEYVYKMFLIGQSSYTDHSLR